MESSLPPSFLYSSKSLLSSSKSHLPRSLLSQSTLSLPQSNLTLFMGPPLPHPPPQQPQPPRQPHPQPQRQPQPQPLRQPQPQPQHQPSYSYLNQYPPPQYQHRRHGRSNLTSCVAATVFLLLLVLGGVLALFVVFRPHDPTIAVSAVQLPGFASANGTASFTFAQLAAVRNPNRNIFSHYDSSLVVLSRPQNQVAGFMFIPAGQIEGGRTQYMSASFSVAGFPVSGNAEVVEVESRMKVKGRVEVLKFLTHHVETTKLCTVAVSSRDGSVLTFRC